MRDAKELLVASKQYAHEDRGMSWWCLTSTFACLGVLLSLACLDLPLVLRVPASVATGLVMIRIFILYHDYHHNAILSGSRLAGLILNTYGIFTLNPPGIWNRSHDHHHKNNSIMFGASIGSYPVMTIDQYDSASTSERISYIISRHPLTIALGYLTVFFYGMTVRSFIFNPRRHVDSAVSVVAHLSLLAFAWYAGGWQVATFAVLLPCAIASAGGAYLFYAQHNFPGVKYRDRDEWSYVFAALHSSSYIKMSPVMHWFTGNIGYHHIHHLNARIPFYRLPEAMAGIEEMQSPTTTSLHPLDIFRCLQLKLWDYENDRLVTFKEAEAVRREFVPKLVKPEDGDDQQAATSPLPADVDVDEQSDTRRFG
jgi:omega-6 fatty acid desaturase (delta-12 desaturase)